MQPGYLFRLVCEVAAVCRTPPDQGARFQVHFEKLRNRVDGIGSLPFEAIVEPFVTDGRDGVRWLARDLAPPILKRAAAMFEEGKTVRAVATMLGVSKSEAGRLRQRVIDEGLFDKANGDGDLSNISESEVAA
jgi:hypothetical protein